MEVIRDLSDLKITDARISSLIRTKDAELYRLRDELTSLSKLKTTVNNDSAFNKTISVLTEENNRLKNEINTLRVDRGSSELIASYKEQVQVLNSRIHELEQEKSNLSAQLLNLKNEYEVRLSVQSHNIDFKQSNMTGYRESEISSDRSGTKYNSPIHTGGISNYGNSSHETDIKMIDSKIVDGGNGGSATYGSGSIQTSGNVGNLTADRGFEPKGKFD